MSCWKPGAPKASLGKSACMAGLDKVKRQHAIRVMNAVPPAAHCAMTINMATRPDMPRRQAHRHSASAVSCTSLTLRVHTTRAASAQQCYALLALRGPPRERQCGLLHVAGRGLARPQREQHQRDRHQQLRDHRQPVPPRAQRALRPQPAPLLNIQRHALRNRAATLCKVLGVRTAGLGTRLARALTPAE